MSASVRPRQADNPSFVLSTWEQREKAQREAFVDDEPEFEISEEVPHAASSEIEDLKKYCVPFRSPSASIRSTFVEGVDPLWGGIEQDNSNDLNEIRRQRQVAAINGAKLEEAYYDSINQNLSHYKQSRTAPSKSSIVNSGTFGGGGPSRSGHGLSFSTGPHRPPEMAWGQQPSKPEESNYYNGNLDDWHNKYAVQPPGHTGLPKSQNSSDRTYDDSQSDRFDRFPVHNVEESSNIPSSETSGSEGDSSVIDEMHEIERAIEKKVTISRARKSKPEVFTTTVPKPFSFAEREELKKASKIVPEKLPEKFEHFRANPIPTSSILPMYNDIISKNEKRREEIRKQAKEETIARQKPFSFYERDIKHKKKIAKQREQQYEEQNTFTVVPFKAKDVPEPPTKPLMQVLKEEEEQRQIRVQKRAEVILHASSLPPRMERYQNAIYEEPQKKPEKTVENVPTINRSIPDFISDQTKFTQALQKAKQNKATTVPQPFSFENRPAPTRKTKRQTQPPVFIPASQQYPSPNSTQFYSKETKSSILLKKKLETDRNMKKTQEEKYKRDLEMREKKRKELQKKIGT